MLSSLMNAPRPRAKYRSKRAVRGPQKEVPTHLVTKWTKPKITMVAVGALILAFTTFLPVLLLEHSSSGNSKHFHAPASLDAMVKRSQQLREAIRKEQKLSDKAGASFRHQAHAKTFPERVNADSQQVPANNAAAVTVAAPAEDNAVVGDQESNNVISNTGDDNNNNENIENIENNNNENKVNENTDTGIVKTAPKQQLARGVSGLPMSKTPALVGAAPGHIECDINVDDIAYWNSPQGKRDEEFISPFLSQPGSYLTFEADPGGWNNIRMSMEIIFVLAAVSGRTLVLPPKAPFYLLGTGKENVKSFGNFFPIHTPEFQNRVKVITMSEFLEKEGMGILGLDDEGMEKLRPVAEKCLHNPTSEISCEILHEVLREKGMQPDMSGSKSCFIFDKQYLETEEEPDGEVKEAIQRFCGEKRKIHYLDKELRDAKLIHWDAANMKHRILQHFYTFMYFTDPVIDNFYKRFVRDYLHYKDQIFCAAGKIVHALNEDAGYGRWSSMHIRRGDFQYKMVKLPAEEWYENTKELWQPGETIFIATDERNKTFFDPIKEHNPVRFLDDYWEIAGLEDLDKYYLGMIDTIVASHGRKFAGTWFSTFTGYINRMRGYLGHSMDDSWYSWLERKDSMQGWTYPVGNYPAKEWPVGWTGIDGDEWIEHELEPVAEPISPPAEGKAVTKSKRTFVNKYTLADLKTDEGFASKPPARGVAGLPVDETPALNSAARAHINCDINVDSLAYWNDPQGERDQQFQPPFKGSDGDAEKYITFTVDTGGWNNIRMSMEIIFVIAAATGRTLVLPPKAPLYRLRGDLKNIHRGFADFFPLDTEEFQKKVKIISTEEFVEKEGGANGVAPIPEDMREGVMKSVKVCNKMKKMDNACENIAQYLSQVGHVPDARAKDYCFVFDEDVFNGDEVSDESEESISTFCGTRKRAFWNPDMNQQAVVHFRAGEKEWRLLAHFYGFIHFTNPAIGNYYKRFVRDYLRYNDQIYCSAGKIVKALQAEAAERGFDPDEEGAGGFSALHVRRGELQYKKVKIPAEEWYENTKEIWKPKEILFIATDERNKTFFDPLAAHFDIRFLDDYFELAGLGDLDPNYFGMIDTIISSRGRAFAGTWFSTFTGYINRMRGYHGMTMMDTWYSFLPNKEKSHHWENIDHFAFAFEWPDGWIGIDGDVTPSKDVF